MENNVEETGEQPTDSNVNSEQVGEGPESGSSETDNKNSGGGETSSSVPDNSATSSKELISEETPTSSSSIPSTPTLAAKKSKIDVVLKPVGDAPILKQKRWTVDPDKEVGSIIQFIKGYLKKHNYAFQPDQSLFLFVNQAFAPSPDQLIRNLYDCFGSDGKLILHYSTTVAWG